MKHEQDVARPVDGGFETKPPGCNCIVVSEEDEDPGKAAWVTAGMPEAESWLRKAWKRAMSSGVKFFDIVL